jgi:tRNA (guanine-N7-)-methyltransferase
VRKPERLPPDQLAPFEWEPPGGFKTQWGEGKADEPPVEKIKIDWASLFGNPNPVEFEVGFGKGLFLITESSRRPSVNFFGVEIIRKYQRYASTRIARRNLPNCKTSWGDAKKILRDYVSPGTVSVVHVFFPDPWWKSRHKKRTLFSTDFAELVWAALTPGGNLNFATDVSDYFDMVRGVMAEQPRYLEIDAPTPTSVEHDMDYLTNFERKFRKEGRPIYRARWAKPL